MTGQMHGVISGTVRWIEHPLYSQGTTFDWAAGLVLVLIAAFLWSTVIDGMLEE